MQQHGQQRVAVPPADPFVPRTAAPGPDGRVRLAVVGDGADGSPESLAVTTQIAALDPDVFAYLGDVYDNGTPFEFDTWYDDPAGYGQFRGITNPAIGNHEYRTDGASPYFAYWGGVPHYYSYDLGGWHLVVLDSTTDFADATGVASQLVPGSAQYDWLAQDLAAHQGSCTIAYMHHPRYSNVVGVSRDGLAQVWQLLVDQNVTMVLAGHAHTYERWTPLDRNGAAAPGGLTQFVVGTGGREIINPKGTEPRVAAETTQPAAGALRLDLGPDDAAFSYATTDGTFTDSGTVPCRHPAPRRTRPRPRCPPAWRRGPCPRRPRTCPGPRPPTPWGSPATPCGAAASRSRPLPAAATSYRDARLLPSVVRVDRRGLRRRRQPLGRLGRRDRDDTLRTASSRSCSPASAAHPSTGPRVHRLPLPGLDRRRRRPAAAPPPKCSLTEAVRPPRVGTRCSLTGGRWLSPYDGK